MGGPAVDLADPGLVFSNQKLARTKKLFGSLFLTATADCLRDPVLFVQPFDHLIRCNQRQ